MGQALSSETHSISGGDGYRYWVGLNMKAFRGCKKTIYNGILLGPGPRWGENVVVKSFTSIPGTKDNWRYEVVKADVTQQMVSMYSDSYRDSPSIRVVSPSIVQMDKVSKVNKWLSNRRGNTTINADDWVSVEEFVSGEFRRFCQWTSVHKKKGKREADDLSDFSHFVYTRSQGNFVACDFQGVINEEDGKKSFVLTDSIIHSLRQEYGPFDQGEAGITGFFKLHKCNRICREWPIPQPLTPPPPFLASYLPLTPPPAFEDIVFPVPRTPGAQQNDPWRRSSSCRVSTTRRRHATGGDSTTQIRTSNTTSDMMNLLGDANISRERSFSTNQNGLQRSRLYSDRLCQDRQPYTNNFLQPLVIPSCPPAYEDCVDINREPT